MTYEPRRGSTLVGSVLTIAGLVLVGLIVRHDSRLTGADRRVYDGGTPFASETARTKYYVTSLASERMGGRLTGTEGERLAADFIISQLKQMGARPLPGKTDYRIPFEFTSGGKDGGSTISPSCANTVDCFQVPYGNKTGDVQALSF